MSDLLAALNSLRERLKEIPQADERRLQELKTELLGRKAGALTDILKGLPALDPETRRTIGGAANVLKRDLEHAIAARELELKRGATALADVDRTLPGRPQWRGGVHIVTQVVDEICDIFKELGFTRVIGPEAETERYNFYALNFPKDHPALDAQDSFYLGGDVLLRTHTSPVQIRTSYFPFTEPSAEMDVQCQICGGSGCAACKQTGWMEILGSGMVHPAVLGNCKLDSEKYTGFAWGMGPERIAMLRHGIPDIRLFFDSDVRFLEQFIR